ARASPRRGYRRNAPLAGTSNHGRRLEVCAADCALACSRTARRLAALGFRLSAFGFRLSAFGRDDFVNGLPAVRHRWSFLSQASSILPLCLQPLARPAAAES